MAVVRGRCLLFVPGPLGRIETQILERICSKLQDELSAYGYFLLGAFILEFTDLHTAQDSRDSPWEVSSHRITFGLCLPLLCGELLPSAPRSASLSHKRESGLGFQTLVCGGGDVTAFNPDLH